MVTCPNCNKQHTYDESHTLGSDHCFTCYHWLGIIKSNAENTQTISLVIDGHHYQTGKMDINREDVPRYSGMGGRKFIIRMKDDGNVFFTRNLWYQGEIPEMFKDRLPDNAEFVNLHKWVDYGKMQAINSD